MPWPSRFPFRHFSKNVVHTRVVTCICPFLLFSLDVCLPQALGQSVTNPSTVLHILNVSSRGAAYETAGLSPDIRQLAGLVIKNYAFQHLPRLPPAVQQMVKQEIIHALTDALTDIRNTAAILVGKISESFPIDTWADVLPSLLQMLDLAQHGQLVVADGALQAVRRMCEDSVEKLSMDTARRPLDSLLPRLIALFACPEDVIRLRALETINSTLFLFSPSAAPHSGSSSSGSSHPAPTASAGSASMTPTSSFNSLSSHGSMAAGSGGRPAAAAVPGLAPGHSSSPPSSAHKGNRASPLTVVAVGAAGAGGGGSGAQALAANMPAFLQGLSALSSDPSPKVSKTTSAPSPPLLPPLAMFDASDPSSTPLHPPRSDAPCANR